jgi:hypothetical protein
VRIRNPRRKIVFASDYKIAMYEDLAKEFLPKICNQHWEDCWISDYSTIFDFGYYDEETLYDLVELEYGVDVRDIADGNLLRIFERLY